ncbi:MAG TPA: discoidin domain-containing protein [Candidatus Limnocylindria bacterium]|nr:discoidin domain-containing protein [Candidatus Limnocylindria bacterium]
MILLAVVLGLTLATAASTAPVVVDDFESVGAWSAHPADGVELTIRSEPGLHGQAMRLDFKFVRGGGYAVVRRAVALDLPDNYRFRFQLRGQAPPNHVEFKLIDASGENVWWQNRRDVHFPKDWEPVSIKRRQIQFAWGPQGGGELRKVAAIELAITAGSGGEGTVWIDDLMLEPLPPVESTPLRPVARASSFRPRQEAALAIDGNASSFWLSARGDQRPWMALDLKDEREIGGLVVHWFPGRHPKEYAVETSSDGREWRTVRTVRNGNGGRDVLHLPETEARHLRLRTLARGRASEIGIVDVAIQPVTWAPSRETFFRAIAADAPRGSYPRSITGEQTYWTVVGVDGDTKEALLGEDGALETGKAGFSIEPFLHLGGRFLTWNDVETDASLEDGHLPIPSVRWRRDSLELGITAFATGAPGQSSIVARYRLRNRGVRPVRTTLFLALRPFQVNPPAQVLNQPGGIAPIRALSVDGQHVLVDSMRVVSLSPFSTFGAATFDQGDVTEFLRGGRVPPHTAANDEFQHASGALAYRLDVPGGGEREVDVLVPLHGSISPLPATEAEVRQWVEAKHAESRDAWRERAGRVTIELPDSAVEHTLKSQLAWILINRDGGALQPGSRSYERSWIRDGSLTSSALLRLGHPEVVREFIDWFTPHLYPNGKVPCCVDRRGADPVPEHDSGGEFIFLVAEYFRYTGDRDLAERTWPAVARAAAYLDSLRQQRRTAAYRAPGKREFYGLLPPSISHEGYSAKPMHSYWDDFFALKGFSDAAFLAQALGRRQDARRLTTIRDQFRRELLASLAAAMARHKIDYLPGAADLGDFDPTSTTIALNPGGALEALPRVAVDRTFEKYWEFFRDRRDGKTPWDAFTPYELRLIGSFVRLGWRERAHELLRFFMEFRRPSGWAHWAEVVGRDARAPRFIGDMPHTWVGSDFVRSILDMLVYTRDRDGALVVAAGVPLEWMSHPRGVTVRNLPTPDGTIGFTIRPSEAGVEIRIDGAVKVPRAGIVVTVPAGFRESSLDGTLARPSARGEIVVRTLPATVVFRR